MDRIVKNIIGKLAKHPLDSFEVFARITSGLTIEIKDGVLDVFVASRDAGISVHALKNIGWALLSVRIRRQGLWCYDRSGA